MSHPTPPPDDTHHHHHHHHHDKPSPSPSSRALARVAQLPCYRIASTLLISASASSTLDALRLRALHDGKRILAPTPGLRSGFILLDPRHIDERDWRAAAAAACGGGGGRDRLCVGGARAVTLAQMREEGVRVDVCVAWRGGRIGRAGEAGWAVQWGVLCEIGVVGRRGLVVGVEGGEEEEGEEEKVEEEEGEEEAQGVACDIIVRPEGVVVHVVDADQRAGSVDFHLAALGADVLDRVPVLQEFKGMMMADRILRHGGLVGMADEGEGEGEAGSRVVSAEERVGIAMVERLMKGYRV